MTPCFDGSLYGHAERRSGKRGHCCNVKAKNADLLGDSEFETVELGSPYYDPLTKDSEAKLSLVETSTPYILYYH